MKRLPVFTDWLYEFDAPYKVLKLALQIAQDATYHSAPKNHTSYPEQFFGDDFDPVREWLDSCLQLVKLDLRMECESLKSSVCWTTLSHKGQWHHAHKHGFSFASGVLYLNESGAETWFSRESVWNPELTTLNLQDPETITLFHKQPTTVGRLIIFPSRLLHSVTEHDRDEPRYSLSFNSLPSGQIGSYSEIHSRRLANITVNQKQ